MTSVLWSSSSRFNVTVRGESYRDISRRDRRSPTKMIGFSEVIPQRSISCPSRQNWSRNPVCPVHRQDSYGIVVDVLLTSGRKRVQHSRHVSWKDSNESHIRFTLLEYASSIQSEAEKTRWNHSKRVRTWARTSETPRFLRSALCACLHRELQ